MKISASSVPPKYTVQWLVFVRETVPPHIPDPELNALVDELFAAGTFRGEKDEIVPIVKGEKICLLAGLGNEPEQVSARTVSVLTKKALNTNPFSLKKPAVIIPLLDEPSTVRAIVDGAQLGLYQWKRYVSNDNEQSSGELIVQTQHTDVVEASSIICTGTNLARDLANENADVADSEFLDKQIRELAETDRRCTVETLNRKELEAKGLRLHLAVNQGSLKEPKLTIVTYRGGGNSDPFTALIGKGITFDSGGVNLKATGSIENMRMDMSGAAAVIGTLHNTIRLDLKTNVYFVCGFAENAIGPKAYKPGDTLVSYCGKSVEIGNTDAEGRLVLADAISYVAQNYKPEAIVDIATLTGAVVFALGYEHSGLMASDRDLANRLLTASRESDDWAWELPIYPELQEHVKSSVADIKNIGESKCAGTISAGEFLRQFAQCESPDLSWAHLDIAGTAKPKKGIAYFENGATGAGVRLLTHFLMRRSGRG